LPIPLRHPRPALLPEEPADAIEAEISVGRGREELIAQERGASHHDEASLAPLESRRRPVGHVLLHRHGEGHILGPQSLFQLAGRHDEERPSAPRLSDEDRRGLEPFALSRSQQGARRSELHLETRGVAEGTGRRVDFIEVRGSELCAGLLCQRGLNSALNIAIANFDAPLFQQIFEARTRQTQRGEDASAALQISIDHAQLVRSVGLGGAGKDEEVAVRWHFFRRGE
jgi:hypothetical protein